MNRNNFWIHLTVAVVIISMAAILGQVRNWRSTLRSGSPNTVKSTPKPIAVKRPAQATFTTLTPRQPLTSAPYAIRSLRSFDAENLGGVPAVSYRLTSTFKICKRKTSASAIKTA